MRDPDLVRLRHLRDAAEKAVAAASGKSRSDLDEDEILSLALSACSRSWARRPPR